VGGQPERPWLALLLAPLVAAGCASFESLKPGTPAQQVQARVGAPAEVWKYSDGEVWEYPLGPSGRQTYMVDIGPDRSVREVRQVLGEETFSRVRPGMSRDEVRRMLGRPAQVVVFPAKNEEVWTWRYMAQAVPMVFHVAFDESSGTVRTTQKLEEILFIDDSE
jgi:outer membrane protein assembly factor BamE (lipoprotein component of BamABCDE complex)